MEYIGWMVVKICWDIDGCIECCDDVINGTMGKWDNGTMDDGRWTMKSMNGWWMVCNWWIGMVVVKVSWDDEIECWDDGIMEWWDNETIWWWIAW